MSDEAPALKKARGEPAFDGARLIRDFVPDRLLKFEQNGRACVIVGTLRSSAEAEPRAALLKLEQKAACADEASLLASLPSLELALSNHSGAEYSFYDAVDPRTRAQYSLECQWPASQRQINRHVPAEVCVVEETAGAYESVVAPFAAAQAGRCGWIDAVCALESERERNLFAPDDAADARRAFIVNVDTKWSTHAPLSADAAVRSAWKGAAWTRDLYLLAISRCGALTSLRDLRGTAGAELVESMRDELRKCALEVYGVPASKLRIFFHYHPQFYRLHAHCCRAEHVCPGSECERAHLLTSVAHNLRQDADFYKTATLTYKLKEGEYLHTLLRDAGLLEMDTAPAQPETANAA